MAAIAWGDVATWVGAIATTGATAVALSLGWSARKEAEHNRAREDERRLSANRRVYGWGTAAGTPEFFEWGASVQNATEYPLHGVAVNIFSDPRFGFSGLSTGIHTLAPGQILQLKGQTPWSGGVRNPPCYVVVTFRDLDGVLCQRHPDGSLSVGAPEAVRFPKSLAD